jgi:hypothetical protein
MVIGEREVMLGVEPAVVGAAEAVESADIDHFEISSEGFVGVGEGRLAVPVEEKMTPCASIRNGNDRNKPFRISHQ